MSNTNTESDALAEDKYSPAARQEAQSDPTKIATAEESLKGLIVKLDDIQNSSGSDDLEVNDDQLQALQQTLNGYISGTLSDNQEWLKVEEQFRPSYEIPSEGWASVQGRQPTKIAGTYVTSSIGTGGVDLNPQTAGCTRPECDVVIENTTGNPGKLTKSGSAAGLTIPANGTLEVNNFDSTDGLHQVKAQASTINVEITFLELS